jgi:hypothetical protein
MSQNLKRWGIPVLVALFLLLGSAAARADITIILQNGFIQQHQRRVTIDTQYTVDKAHAKPNPPSKDGDMHIAGRADEVKLPIVAEIMNAADDLAAVQTIHDVEGTGNPIALSGVWRLWCEHGGNSQQIQGAPLDPITTTNPDHVFEIHPITSLQNRSLLGTLKPIQGFQTKDAQEAFTKYEGIRCRIIPGDDTTTLVTTMAGYNYVEFVMELLASPEPVEDGVFVFCKVLDLQGELLVHKRRMVMVKDSVVEQKTRNLPIGTRLHVLGLPRIDLSLVSWRVQAAAKGNQDPLTWGLPYEIIVVGFYEYAPSDTHNQIMLHSNGLSRPRGFIPRTLTPKELHKYRVLTEP